MGAFFMGKVIRKWDLMGEKFAGANCPLVKVKNIQKSI